MSNDQFAGKNDKKLQINWFPGHMVTTLRAISNHLKLCDVIVYALDARCPVSCINPKFTEFTERKPTLFILNKSDLAPRVNHFELKPYITLDSTMSGSSKKIVSAVKNLLAEKIALSRIKGITKTIRAIVIGVTNCGKSTLINNLVGKTKAKAADKPGVTRTEQWVTSGDNFWVLDTPGTLYPNMSGKDESSQQIAKNLAYVGSIRDEVLDFIMLAKQLLIDLEMLEKGSVEKRFGSVEFEEICRKRGYVLRGGLLDEERAAKAILTEFRAGKIGKFNLDRLILK